MSRWPPSARGTFVLPDGSVRIEWALWPEDADEPDEIHVELISHKRLTADKPLAGDVRSYDVPVKEVEAYRKLLEQSGLAGIPHLEGQVVFVWSDGATKVGGFSQALPPAEDEPAKGTPTGDEDTKKKPADRRIPVLSRKTTHPKTIRQRNSISVTWVADNFNWAEMRWGLKGNEPARTLRLKPKKVAGDVIYEGLFTTDVGLASGSTYYFTMRVKNTHHRWEFTNEPPLEVVAARNYNSVRQFLAASQVPPGTSVRQAGLAVGSSLRAWLEP